MGKSLRTLAGRLTLTSLGLLALGSPASGGTLVVNWDGSGDYLTIQAALDAASNGEAVVVMPSTGAPAGAYVENVNFPERPITLQSSDPADPATVAATVIDGGAAGRVVSFGPNTPVGTHLAGFTIRNGADSSGAGVYILGASPTIDHCVLTGNHASNPDQQVIGGTLFAYLSDAVIRDCAVVENSVGNAREAYAVVAFLESNPTLERVVIAGNDLVATSASPPDTIYAGGLYLFNSTASLHRCLIAGNTCTADRAYGAGVSTSGGTLQMRSSTIVDNVCVGAVTWGAGLRSVGNTTLDHCTLSGNSAQTGSAVWAYGTGHLNVLHNSIFWDNPTTSGPPIWLESGASGYFDFCDVEGGRFNIGTSGGQLFWDSGSFDADPQFVAPAGPDENPTTWADNDYHLAAGSPCINRGNPAFAPLPEETDIDGDPRVIGCWNDVGSDETPYGGYGDLDNDGSLSAGDHAAFVPCLAGPEVSAAVDCYCADLDADGDVDLRDFAALARTLGG